MKYFAKPLIPNYVFRVSYRFTSLEQNEDKKKMGKNERKRTFEWPRVYIIYI